MASSHYSLTGSAISEILGCGPPDAYLASMRSCSKCNDPAQVVLSFDYRTRVAWLCDLDARFDRFTEIPLCEMHAERLVAPQGWELLDERMAEPPLFLALGVA